MWSLIHCIIYRLESVSVHCSRNPRTEHQTRVRLVDFSFDLAIFLDLEFHIKDECCILIAFMFIQISEIRVSECDKIL